MIEDSVMSCIKTCIVESKALFTDEIKQAIAKGLCKSNATAQCAPYCLHSSSIVNTGGDCPDRLMIWEEGIEEIFDDIDYSETSTEICENIFSELSGAAKEVMGQLFVKGPTVDGNLASKSGRDELVDKGLAFRVNGFQSLSKEGLTVAIEAPVENWANKRWQEKKCGY